MTMASRNDYAALRQSRQDLFAPRPAGQYQIQEGGEVSYRDNYLLVLNDVVLMPDGATGKYLRIVSPPESAPGAVVLPIIDGKVVLLDHPRHAPGRALLEAPRGFGETGETALECARRELDEELGAVVQDFYPLGHIYPDSGLLTTRVALFAATLASISNLTPEPGVRAVFLTIDELEVAIRDGEIEDGFTIAAYCRARLHGII